jgi:hypothetical protein
MSATFDASKMPSHRMNSGTQASDGMALSALRVGSSSLRAVALAPVSAPTAMPPAAPMAKPTTTRHRVAKACVQSSPVAARP